MKLIGIGNYYVNPDTIAYVYGKSKGNQKDLTAIEFTGGARSLEIGRYIDDVLADLGWQGTAAQTFPKTR